jgi:cytochrome c-type biogenesis protein CcmH/NrfG
MALGEAYTRLNRPEEAAQSYSRTAQLAPNTPLALEAQKRARLAMGF